MAAVKLPNVEDGETMSKVVVSRFRGRVGDEIVDGEPSIHRRAKSLDRLGDDFASLAAQALSASRYSALILETPSERIVAANLGAAKLLDPGGGDVVGRKLSDFTSDRPIQGPDMFAGGRLNGFQAIRVLRRRRGSDVKVRMWVRSFADQPSTEFVLVVLVADKVARGALGANEEVDLLAAFGIADSAWIIERISSDAESMFGVPVTEIIGRSLVDLVSEHDKANLTLALCEAAAAAQNGVTLYLDVSAAGRRSSDPHNMVRGCEVLILPLTPAPSCAFVFIRAPIEMSRTHVVTDLRSILARLGRGAEIGQLVRGATAGLTDRDMPGLNRLTTRELEILARLLDGDRAPAIAAGLFLSQGTVRNHLASIFSKVDVTSQQQLLNLFRDSRARAS